MGEKYMEKFHKQQRKEEDVYIVINAKDDVAVHKNLIVLSCAGGTNVPPERAVYFGLGIRLRAAVNQPGESSNVQKKLNRMLYRKPRDFQLPLFFLHNERSLSSITDLQSWNLRYSELSYVSKSASKSIF